MKNSIFVSIIIFITASIPAQVLDNKFNNSSLLYSATISVTIGGDFPITGSFPALISERVDQFITRLYIEAKERAVRITNDPQMIAKIESELDDYSLRGILLKRSNGDELIVDLQRFRSGGDFSYNPYLKNDDVLIFPVNDHRMKSGSLCSWFSGSFGSAVQSKPADGVDGAGFAVTVNVTCCGAGRFILK